MNKLFCTAVISLFFLISFTSAQSLQIDDFSIKVNGEAEMISIKKDGKVTVHGDQIGVLDANGTLKNLAGKTLATIDKTGKVTANGKLLGIVDKNGKYDNGSGMEIEWTKDGKFNLFETKFLTVSPNKKEFYQTAAFLIVLNTFASEVKTGNPTALSIDK